MKFLIVPLVFLAGIIPACAEPEITLWVPEHMILGNTYHGIIIIPETTQHGMIAFLSTGDDLIAQTPDSVSVLPYQNHGIFLITPQAKGTTEIFAAISGDLYNAQTQVFSSKSEPAKLHLITPANKTKADSMLVYVMLHDENNSPVITDKDIQIHLSTSDAINAPPQIMIKNGTTHTRFEMDVGGTGHITASADTLAPHRTDIEKIQNEFTVRIAAAPKIAMQDSYTFYYVWLEKDGRPLKLPYVVDASVHSADVDVARFGASPAVGTEQTVLHLVEGVGKGIIYTGKRGFATVTASIAEIGAAQDILFVGPAKFRDVHENESRVVKLNEQDLLYSDETEHEANTILLWVYPTVTDEQMWGVAATYHIDKTRYVDQSIDESGAITSDVSQDAVVTPARADGFVHVSSSSGLEHGGTYALLDQITKTNAIEWEMSGTSHGHYEINVSGSGLESANTQVDVMPQYAQDFGLHLVAIPVIPNTRQDVAMVSVLDETGAMINPDILILKDTQIRISAGSAQVVDTVHPTHSGSAVIHGTISESDTINAILHGADSARINITPARTATSLELLAPERVHVTESFPFAVHHVDSNGIPVRKTDSWKISSSPDLDVHGDFMTLKDSGDSKVSIVSKVGAVEYDLTGFENTMDVNFDLPKNDYRIGETLTFEIQNSVDAEYTLVTDYPFEQVSSDVFVITLDSETESTEITVLATRDGYQPVSVSETINVKEIYSLEILAAESPSSKRLATPFDVTINDQRTSVIAPYYTEFRPENNIIVEFPEKTTVHNNGYSFDVMRVNGKAIQHNTFDGYPSKNIEIVAEYHREILIDVIAGSGSGIYRSGDTVTISAPDQEILWFLIRDTFDYWEGIDVDSPRTSFAAAEDLIITAVYREDYTYLMISVMVPLLGASALVLSQKMTGVRWMMQNLLEGMLGMFKNNVGKTKKDSKKNRSEKNQT